MKLSKKTLLAIKASYIRKAANKGVGRKRKKNNDCEYAGSKKWLQEKNIYCSPIDLEYVIKSKSDGQLIKMMYTARRHDAFDYRFDLWFFTTRSFAIWYFLAKDKSQSWLNLQHQKGITAEQSNKLIDDYRYKYLGKMPW